MTNPIKTRVIRSRGEEGLSINGKKYKLVPTMAAISEVENTLGQPFGEIIDKILKFKLRFSEIVSLIQIYLDQDIDKEVLSSFVEDNYIESSLLISTFTSSIIAQNNTGKPKAAKVKK